MFGSYDDFLIFCKFISCRFASALFCRYSCKTICRHPSHNPSQTQIGRTDAGIRFQFFPDVLACHFQSDIVRFFKQLHLQLCLLVRLHPDDSCVPLRQFCTGFYIPALRAEASEGSQPWLRALGSFVASPRRKVHAGLYLHRMGIRCLFPIAMHWVRFRPPTPAAVYLT